VNKSVWQAQAEADQEFTTVDPTVWEALPGITNPVLLAQGEQVTSSVAAWTFSSASWLHLGRLSTGESP
jgi:hypothetical protein